MEEDQALNQQTNNDEEQLDQIPQEDDQRSQDQGQQDDQQDDQQGNESQEENQDQKQEEERPPSRREQLRISQILAKREQATPTVPQPLPQTQRIDYAKDLDAQPETVKQLEEDRTAAQNAGYQAGLQTANSMQWRTRLDIDAPKIESKYSYLDPNNKAAFDPIRANAMNQLYLDYVGYEPADPQTGKPETVARPDIRYSEFVEAQMEFAQALTAEQQVRTAQNIAKQAGSTGLRPDGSAAKPMNLNKAPGDMTDEELEAAINATMPSR